MPGKYILFLSTNTIWGGSEILWTESAKKFIEKGYTVKAAVRYDYELIQPCITDRRNYIDLKNYIKPPANLLRVLQKIKLGKFPPRNILHSHFKKNKPDLVIISQGNNIEGRLFMKDCIQFDIPFVTLTHLVTPDFWPSLNDDLINELNTLYQQARCNYFVSKSTLLLHEKLVGKQLTNSYVVYNPFIKTIPAGITYPSLVNGVYKVALIGRIETFHKGYDLLIDVLKNEKWKKRPVHFSLFGKGPHVQLLKRLIEINDIRNISLHNHVEEIAEIWKTHHILMMPSRMEGQSLSLIEAMRFNRAAIVTNAGGTAELLEEGVTGFMAEYAIPEFIDAALERAWEKRNDWEQLGIEAGKSIARKHPADALSFFVNRIEEALSEIYPPPEKGLRKLQVKK
jgi:glycosyltransferase involved in cell wall biosynthesis